ncbi:MAG: S-methyl-5'-thioadenosine phosphorylase [Sphingomonadales bacterium]
MSWCLGVIGGSGLYAIDGLEDGEWVTVETPWGEPSDAILCGQIAGIDVRFLPRHGRGHRIPPGRLNVRANIDALKRLGVTDLLAVSAVGSLNAAMAPGDFVVVDQFIDRTVGRPASFFDTGLVGHVPMADPTCPRLSALVADAVAAAGGRVHRGATYLAMEGPAFSTRAESRLHRAWGCDLVGMTAMPEAKLAREAELPYALAAMVTDFDCWHEGDDVDVTNILAVMHGNAALARAMIVRLCAGLPAIRAASPIDTVLDTAIMTAPAQRDPALLARNGAILARWLANQRTG